MESPGFANQASSYSAEVARRAIFSPYARTAVNAPGILAGGTLSASDLILSAPGSGLSVNVSTGEAVVGGSEGGTQGGYYARNASTTNLTISTANPTNPRIDTVCVTIADSGYTEPTGVSGNAAVLQVVTGTPTSGANLTNLSGKAALPASSLLLGYVLVPASASNIITADIANKATVVTPGFFGTSGLGDGQPLVFNGSTSQWRSLAAGAGNATFLQLPSAQLLQLSVGNSSVSFSGTSLSNTVAVSHGLGRTPTITLVTATTDNGVAFAAFSANSTQFSVQGVNATGSLTATVTFSWLVIG